MAAFFATGAVADLILAAMVLEFFALVLRAPAWARARRAETLAIALAPGACLALALRFALTDAPWPWIAAALVASLPLHWWDLARRR
ncbi:MAG: hypothetical protein NW203_15505 [Hyphomonadaceae bacterium]|nr:hypothetical protein [Hyphomonadaceae bacterium]